jgi:hypothetical protein
MSDPLMLRGGWEGVIPAIGEIPVRGDLRVGRAIAGAY